LLEHDGALRGVLPEETGAQAGLILTLALALTLTLALPLALARALTLTLTRPS
jgi:hypothetical protein